MVKAKSKTRRHFLQRSKQKDWQYGLGMNAFHGARVQKGYGLGSILGGLVRRALPYLWTGAKHAGKMALKTGVDVANDVMDGQDIKSSVKARTRQAGKRLANKMTSSVLAKVGALQAGRGKKKKIVKKRPRKNKITSAKASNRSTSNKRSRGKKGRKVRTLERQDIFGYY